MTILIFKIYGNTNLLIKKVTKTRPAKRPTI